MKVALLFPGQGSQGVGMGRDLAARYQAARTVFETADRMLPFPLSEICWQGPETTLKQTSVTQPALYTASAAVLRVMSSRGVRYDGVAGHSVGEYAALLAAGVIDFETGLKLVARRGELMRDAAAKVPGTMAAVLGLTAAQVQDVCRKVREAGHGVVETANLNGAGQVVISGEPNAVAVASDSARAAGARKVIPLAVSGGFHSTLMDGVSKQMVRVLANATVNPAVTPVIANVTAEYEHDADDIRKNLASQVSSPVRWEETLQKFLGDGFDTFVEVGHGTVLGGIIRRVSKDSAVYETNTVEAVEQTIRVLKGGD